MKPKPEKLKCAVLYFTYFYTVYNLCVFVVQLTLVDMIIYGALEAANCYAVRWSRVLRPLLLVNVTEGRQVTTRLSHLSGFYLCRHVNKLLTIVS